MNRAATGPHLQCRDSESGHSEFGGLLHAPCKSLHHFAILSRCACGASGNYGRHRTSRGPQSNPSLRLTAQGLSQLGWQRKSRLGTIPYGKSQEFTRILEGEQEGAVAILELSSCSSRSQLAKSPTSNEEYREHTSRAATLAYRLRVDPSAAAF